jgi:hypothetical protein
MADAVSVASVAAVPAVSVAAVAAVPAVAVAAVAAVAVLFALLIDVNLNDRVRLRARVVADLDLPVARRGTRRNRGAQESKTQKPHSRDSSSHFVSLHTSGSNRPGHGVFPPFKGPLFEHQTVGSRVLDTPKGVVSLLAFSA